MVEGDPSATFAILIEGSARVTRHGREVGTASAGSILGELGVLRGQPRMATVTAVVPSLAAVGAADVLVRLVDHPEVLRRLRDLASARLAHDCRPVEAHLGDGSLIRLRPLLPEDRDGIAAALASLSPEFRRRRFFTSAVPSEALLDYLVAVDYVDHFAWLVDQPADHADGWAVARYVRDPGQPDQAEVAFSVSEPLQGRGLGTFLLGALGVAALGAGITTLVGHVLEDNAPMRAVFAKAGAVSDWDEPGVVRIQVASATAAGLVEPDVRAELEAATHDIVTAATLALTNLG